MSIISFACAACACRLQGSLHLLVRIRLLNRISSHLTPSHTQHHLAVASCCCTCSFSHTCAPPLLSHQAHALLSGHVNTYVCCDWLSASLRACLSRQPSHTSDRLKKAPLNHRELRVSPRQQPSYRGTGHRSSFAAPNTPSSTTTSTRQHRSPIAK